MAEKLYYKDSFIKEFSSVVLKVTEEENIYKTVLDKTAFFPEGGGQSADTGYIENARVLDVQEIDGEIIHFCDKKLSEGSSVFCKIDWEERFRKMQIHSAEHIVSGVVYKLFGFNNVGFHLSRDYTTMDYDGELTREQLNTVEDEANRIVYENVDVETYFPESEELKMLSYRSKLELTEDVRIVKIGTYDTCACCAPHVKKTGEIGIIKLLDFIRYKGGVRINLTAGKDALSDYRERYENIAEISRFLSAKQNEVKEAVERLQKEAEKEKRRANMLSEKLAEKEIEALRGNKNILLFTEIAEAEMLRNIANIGKEACSGISFVFAPSDKGGYRCVIASKSKNLKEMQAELTEKLSLKAGGSAEMLQGNAFCEKDVIEKFFSEI